MRLLFLYSHPIQYFAPLSRFLAASGRFDVRVCYCSTAGLAAAHDPGFGVPVQWDIPLLEGYASRFLPNWRGAARGPAGFWSLVNPGILRVLWQAPESYVVVHGWGHCTHLLAIVFGRLMGHRICLRGESPLSHEQRQPFLKKWLKKLIFKNLLFPWVNHFLYIGEQNRAFYRYCGVPEHKLIFTPYCVDNARFQAERRTLPPVKTLRRNLDLPPDAPIVLCSGKYIDKKRPMDLLRAFHRAGVPDSFLVFLGEGALRGEMERYCREQGLEGRVRLTGFVNQSNIGQYYACADLFVLCSGTGETWGLAANEAMNFGLPLLLSDLCGCADDLCRPGQNGLLFETGNVEALAAGLRQLLGAGAAERARMGACSEQIVAKYGFEEILKNLSSGLQA